MDILNDISPQELHVDNIIESSLKESSGWAKFIAIAGMAISGIGAVMSFTLGGRIESALNEGMMRSGTEGYLWIFVILIFAVSFFILCIYLFKFANRTQVALHTFDNYEFKEAMRSLKNTYKGMAILFSVYVLLTVGAAISNFIL